MSAITKERVQFNSEGSDCQANAEQWEVHELARIALASLEAEAVGEVIEQQSGMMMDGLVISEKQTYRNIKGIHKMKMMPLGTKFYTAPPAPANAEPVAWLWSHRKHPREVTLVRPEDDEKAEAALWSGWSCQALYAEVPASTPMKDHQIRELVNELRNIAVEYHGTQQLRERIARTVRAAMLQGAEPDFREISNSSTNNFRENAETSTKCWCHTCRPVKISDMRFVVCPDCGNKRCPHANDHRNACTGSNEPGQEGSAYPAAPQQEVK
ncbi:hypothetical protein [Enterobacter sp. CPE_E423]|uniref:hypothetical protein n=1 Tax=unclassified Enterobacter TaxID=2608935 RepID=UPI0039752CAA